MTALQPVPQKYYVKLFADVPGSESEWLGWLGRNAKYPEYVTAVEGDPEAPAPSEATPVDWVGWDPIHAAKNGLERPSARLNLYLQSNGRVLDGGEADGWYLYWWPDPIPEKGYPLNVWATDNLHLVKISRLSKTDPKDARVSTYADLFGYYPSGRGSYEVLFMFVPITTDEA